MTRYFQIALTTGFICFLVTGSLRAQVCGPCYTVQPQTVMEEQLEQRLRVVYDTVWEDREVVTQRPVLRTRYETRKYTVSKPVVETSTVQERYTVLKPVTRREWIDRSYDETTYVTETAEREETYTTYRPVTETTYQQRNYVVQRPVTETQYQTRQYTTYQPVTTYQTSVVDQGQYYAQQYYQPGDTRYGLRWVPPGTSSTMYGTSYRRGGLGWVPYTSPGQTYAQLQYVPNPVQVAVPQTQLVPQVQQQQVPVQVTRMENQVVQEQVPVTQTRMEAVQETRKVPYSVQRPVTRRVERKEPVDRVEWVEQEMVRPKTVRRTSYKLETVEKEVPVQFYETESVSTTVKVARKVPRYETYTVRRLVPRTVQSPVVLSYYDAYSGALAQSSSGWLPSSSSIVSSAPVTGSPTPAPTEEVTYGAAKPVMPEVEEESELPEGGQQRLRKVETVDPSAEQDATEGSAAASQPGQAAEGAQAGESSEEPASDDADLELSPSDGEGSDVDA